MLSTHLAISWLLSCTLHAQAGPLHVVSSFRLTFHQVSKPGAGGGLFNILGKARGLVLTGLVWIKGVFGFICKVRKGQAGKNTMERLEDKKSGTWLAALKRQGTWAESLPGTERQKGPGVWDVSQGREGQFWLGRNKSSPSSTLPTKAQMVPLGSSKGLDFPGLLTGFKTLSLKPKDPFVQPSPPRKKNSLLEGDRL